MFIDVVKMKIVSGKGGDGCTSFRREKFVPMGGPDGGTGGKGGDIVFVGDKNLQTLIDLKYKKVIKATKGENGKGKNQKGANASDVIIKVPLGTVIYDDDTGDVLADITSDGENIIIGHGGRGGRGNTAFATHENPAPKFSELGEPGETKFLKCELKVIADVGLVGLPSVGKSTILNAVTNASVKTDSYHFTTLSPNLGVVTLKDRRSFVLADLPGLIEGASKGIGLGFSFLRHAERTKIIAHVIDMAGTEGNNPINDYETIRKELVLYSDALASKKEIIVANKKDMPSFKDNLELFKKRYPDKQIFTVSGLTHEGLDELMIHLKDTLDSLSEEEITIDDNPVVYKFIDEKPYTITKKDGLWVIEGKEIEKLFLMTRFDEDEAVKRFARKLKGMGVEDELTRLGAKRGDEVSIMDYVFEFKE